MSTRSTRKISASVKIELLNKIVLETGQLVKRAFQTKDGTNLGQFLDSLLGARSGTRLNQRFKKELSVWREKYPELFRLLDERIESREN